MLVNSKNAAALVVTVVAVVTELVNAQCLPAAPSTAPDSAFIAADGADGGSMVTHMPTGLTWTRCSLDQSWQAELERCAPGDASGGYTWEEALILAEQAEYGGFGDWRLPNKKELASLIEFACANPAINSAFFPDTAPVAYWSSTPLPPGFSPAAAWSINFADGSFTSVPRTSALQARLVRSD